MTKKQSNFQLLKIIAMVMIVAHHLVSQNTFNVDTEIVGLTINKLLLQVLGNNAFIANNLFFLISAWFLSSKADDSVNLKYSFASCARLERIVLFYSISLLLLTSIFKGGVNVALILKSVFPTLFGLWWYPTTYIVFLLIWPFYHKGLKALDDDDLKKCIIVMLGIWSVSTLIPYVDLGANNFCAFLMLYAVTIYVKKNKVTYLTYKKQCIGCIVIPYIFAIISIIALDLLGTRFKVAATYSCYYLRGNFRLVSMLVSIGFFIWGISWKIKYNKGINYIADATFGVYLIHMYPTVTKYLFSDVFNLGNFVDKNYCILYLIYGTIAVFSMGVLLDKLRVGIFYIAGELRKHIFIRG